MGQARGRKMKLLLYCTKAKPYLYRQDDDCFELLNKLKNEDTSGYKKYYGLNNGKIVAECDFEVEEIINYHNSVTYYTQSLNQQELLNKSCLGICKLDNYLKGQNGYAIYIKNLHIFDEPNELSDYHISYFDKDLGMMREHHIEKAPQNMCKAFNTKNNYILISIHPQWLCKILNGEKTIEIRKKVLKEILLLKNDDNEDFIEDDV